MATKGAIGFRVGEIDKIAYNHSDSYPGCLGFEVAAARTLAKERGGQGRNAVASAAR